MTGISHEELSLFHTVDSSTKINNALLRFHGSALCVIYEGWNFNSGNYLFTTDTK